MFIFIYYYYIIIKIIYSIQFLKKCRSNVIFILKMMNEVSSVHTNTVILYLYCCSLYSGASTVYHIDKDYIYFHI